MKSTKGKRKENPVNLSIVTNKFAKEQENDEIKLLRLQHLSATILQRSWMKQFKQYNTNYIVDYYLKNGPTIDHVKSISFESLVVFLREKHIVSLSKRCLQRIHLLCTFRHGSPSKALTPENVNVKVFLAGLMIAYRSTHVFESIGTLEQALLEVAIPLHTTFQNICNTIAIKHSFQDVPHELSKNFVPLLFEYLKRFKAWKVPDEAKLICRIKHALIALYQAESHLPLDEPDDSKLKIEFKTQIERLRSKLSQIGGQDALKLFDEQRQTGIISGCSGGSGGSGNPNNPGGAGGAYAALPGRMSNEQLAHELLLDPNFQLDEDGGCGIENPVFHHIRESFHKAFWDSLVDDLRLATPCYARVLRVLKEIYDGINDLVGTREQINEIIDIDYIKQQVESNLYTWDNCKNLISSIVGVIQRTQAPKRNNETKTIWKEINTEMQEALDVNQPKVFCKALEFLLNRVNAMRVDAANTRLRLISPVIKDHGIDYERGKLQDKINDGSLTLERTQGWVRVNLRREVTLKNIILDDLLKGTAASFVHVHSSAMVSLISNQTTIKADMCPETLLFDVHRLAMLQREFQYIVTSVTMCITVMAKIKTTRKTSDLNVLPKITNLFTSKEILEINSEQTIVDINEILKESSLSQEDKQTLYKSLNQCMSPTDAVNQLMSQRIIKTIQYIMKNNDFPNDINYAKDFMPMIYRLSTKIMSLANLNRTVHLPTYNKLIGEETLNLKAEIQV